MTPNICSVLKLVTTKSIQINLLFFFLFCVFSSYADPNWTELEVQNLLLMRWTQVCPKLWKIAYTFTTISLAQVKSVLPSLPHLFLLTFRFQTVPAGFFYTAVSFLPLRLPFSGRLWAIPRERAMLVAGVVRACGYLPWPSQWDAPLSLGWEVPSRWGPTNAEI